MFFFISSTAESAASDFTSDGRASGEILIPNLSSRLCRAVESTVVSATSVVSFTRLSPNPIAVSATFRLSVRLSGCMVLNRKPLSCAKVTCVKTNVKITANVIDRQ